MTDQRSQTYTMTIGGNAATAGNSLDVIDPATEQVVATVPDAGAAELDQAVAAARAAFPVWAATSLDQRRQALATLADVIDQNVEELASLLTLEQGKPLRDARAEIGAASYWFREVAQLEIPVETLQDTARALVKVVRRPIGVVGAIVPWNIPIMLAAWKVAPALLVGNTVVLKPAPTTPLTTLRIGELTRELLPAGVLNVISGGDELGPLVSAHPGIDKLSFTGSTATGRRVMESASVNLKRLTLELGGNDPAIVMPDVDVARAAQSLFWGAFGNCGQVCIAAKRVYVHAAVYDQFRDEFVKLASRARIGPGSEEGVEIGPVQNRRQFERLREILDDSRSAGHRFAAGGESPSGPGLFFPITVVDNPPDEARIVKEEPFGPILPLLKFDTVDEVVQRANDSDFGLGASVWSTDESVALAIAERLETGTVWINEIQTASPRRPMGGMKQSGIGVENGIEGLLSYTVPQTISVRRAA